MIGGFKCWMGINTILPDNEYGLPPDQCEMGPLYLNAYLFFNVIYNFLIVLILKHGSANIMWMASTIIVPLSNLAFSMKFMPHSQPMTIWDFLGLMVIMFGLIVYRFTSSLHIWWSQYTHTFTKDQMNLNKLENTIDTKSQQKQIIYYGLNQMESLNAVVDGRLISARAKVLHRSPSQVRNSYLVKIGLPASPLISTGAKNRGVSSNSPGALNRNGPGIERKLSERWDVIKKRSSLDGLVRDPNLLPKPNNNINITNSKKNGGIAMSSPLGKMEDII